jgi:low affinity Fe/Cu permease
LALGICVGWALTGPVFDYSDTWQLVINTSTTIVTFLMVFLIQNTQNRDAIALHLKLDELLRAVAAARTGFVEVEDLSDEEIAALQREFKMQRARAGRMLSLVETQRRRVRSRRRDRHRGAPRPGRAARTPPRSR